MSKMLGRPRNQEREWLRLFVHAELNLDITKRGGCHSRISLSDLRKIAQPLIRLQLREKRDEA